jgi:hypothetical protein
VVDYGFEKRFYAGDCVAFPALRWLHVVGLLLFTSYCARADILHLGTFSYDQLIQPGGGSPGVNDFGVNNFSFTFSLPPDFPASTPFIFQNVSVTLVDFANVSQTISIGEVGPGSTIDPSLQFLDTHLFVSAELKATLSMLSIGLSNGTTFLADSDTVDVPLMPSFPPTLQVGDFALIDVMGSIEVTQVPEPAAWLLLLTVSAVIAHSLRIGQLRHFG